jgi:alkanesulfonate monooxygenase SsuD/methylene tetrahydromethanopterin reductase-like flavin-dependent oxidoreductase (luciferase family)
MDSMHRRNPTSFRPLWRGRRRSPLGTGICLVHEHNPVVLAKQVASLDKLSGGRFDFGVGIGWLAEEFAAVGVPWERAAG